MLSSGSEITQTLHLIESAKQTLRAEKITFDEKIQVGGMIEIPAAALCLDIFMRKLDFLSIGTNDLIQYTLAIDRADDAVAHLYDSLHPAVLRLVAHILRSANRTGVPVSVCGEIAGDILYAKACCDLCRGEPACRYWTWTGPSAAPWTNVCCLKYSDAGATSDSPHWRACSASAFPQF